MSNIIPSLEVVKVEAGRYKITSTLPEHHVIGRRQGEDRSLRPKSIIWDFENVAEDDDRYYIKCGGAYVGSLDNMLFAFLQNGDDNQPPANAAMWQLKKAQAQEGYLIVCVSGDRPGFEGWQVWNNEVEDQVLVRVLLVTPTEPARYPETELFNLERLE
ncbi:hypothetical protein AA313_de0202983 [Arthrobotrys entomopaga]|nr:hypothetical protein AA313_de0202983 [Arthrobotrys entomopaga]